MISYIFNHIFIYDKPLNSLRLVKVNGSKEETKRALLLLLLLLLLLYIRIHTFEEFGSKIR